MYGSTVCVLTFTRQEERIYPKMDMSDPDRKRPRELLCNTPEYFENLFEVLSLRRESVVSSSWSLIQLLPINDRVLHDIKAIGGDDAVDFSKLFSAASPLKLLYALQIVDKYASPSTKETIEHKTECKAWCDAFVAKGGVQHLLSVFQACDVDAWVQSTLPQSAFTLLVKVIVTFLTPDRFEDSLPALAGVDTAGICQRLFAAVAAAVRTAATVVEKSDDDDVGVFEVKDEGALAPAKKKQAKTKDAGTGGNDMEDEDPLDLNKDTPDADGERGEAGEGKELLQSKLVRMLPMHLILKILLLRLASVTTACKKWPGAALVTTQ